MGCEVAHPLLQQTTHVVFPESDLGKHHRDPQNIVTLVSTQPQHIELQIQILKLDCLDY